jgi:hypothetical protein
MVNQAQAEASKFVENATPQAQEAIAAATRAVDAANQVKRLRGLREDVADRDPGTARPKHQGGDFQVRREDHSPGSGGPRGRCKCGGRGGGLR